MDREFVREQLYERYLAPTRKQRENYMGIEIEMPILNLEKQAVDFDVIHNITDCFMKYFRFSVSYCKY